MLYHVDPLAPEPIFEQIAFQVKGAVARGELKSGDRLPSVRDFARMVAVNPNTVVKAYDVLTGEGVIVRRQGAGCFVTGSDSVLGDVERQRKLTELLSKAVTEAYHLGYGPAAVKQALSAALKEVSFPKGRGRRSS